MTSEPAWKSNEAETEAGQVQPKPFEFSFKMMRQCINDAFMKSAFCILYWTLSDTLSSLVDSRHLIDLMLVDRMFKSRFDS
jgi:hypothetical protein